MINNLKQLESILNKNIDKNEMINDFISFYDEIIDNESVDEYISDNHVSSSKAMMDLFKEVYSSDSPNIIELKEDDYSNNPYLKNILIEPFKDKHYELTYYSFYKYQPILFDNVKFNGLENIINIGFFKEDTKFKFLSLSHNNNIWMEITPHEVNTMKDAINNANGNCVVYGLGLGYFAYMISIKDNVNKITIVEKDRNIIELFKSKILPKFPYISKIEIVEENALNYKVSDDTNYVFIDLWRDTNDAIPLYLKLIKKEKENIKYDYWIEDSILEMIRRYIICKLINRPISDSNYILINNEIRNKNIESLELDSIRKLIK